MWRIGISRRSRGTSALTWTLLVNARWTQSLRTHLWVAGPVHGYNLDP
jgi:hypothetical protein